MAHARGGPTFILLGISIMAIVAGIFIAQLVPQHLPATAPLAMTLDTEGCMPVGAPCTARHGDVALTVELAERVVYLTPFAIEVRLSRLDAGGVRSVSAQFDMVGMSMGVNRIALERSAEEAQRWHAKAILPVCASGRRDWVMTVDVVSESARYRATMPLEVQPPGQPG
jgi:hypothetical protein